MSELTSKFIKSLCTKLSIKISSDGVITNFKPKVAAKVVLDRLSALRAELVILKENLAKTALSDKGTPEILEQFTTASGALTVFDSANKTNMETYSENPESLVESVEYDWKETFETFAKEFPSATEDEKIISVIMLKKAFSESDLSRQSTKVGSHIEAIFSSPQTTQSK